METAVMGLDKMPEAYPKAYESASFGNLNLRQLICKNHRIIFLVKEDSVYVLAVLNCRQNLISDEALEKILA
jgi:plasmid stabilization system protein ParE